MVANGISKVICSKNCSNETTYINPLIVWASLHSSNPLILISIDEFNHTMLQSYLCKNHNRLEAVLILFQTLFPTDSIELLQLLSMCFIFGNRNFYLRKRDINQYIWVHIIIIEIRRELLFPIPRNFPEYFLIQQMRICVLTDISLNKYVA